MANIVYYALTFVDCSLGAGGLFAVCFLSLTLAFLFALILAVFAKGNTIKKRIWFVLFLGSVSGIELGLSLILGYGVGFSVLNLSVGALFCIPIFTVRVRGKADKNQIELARFLDDKLRWVSAENQSFEQEKPQKETKLQDAVRPSESKVVENLKPTAVPEVTSKITQQKKPCEIDFSHVKNVISRLEYFPLGISDKKQIKDLQTMVFSAENGDYTPDLKGRINDGLGNLLKIMAKYGA